MAQIVCFSCTLKNKYGTFISSSINRDVLTSLPGDSGLLNGLAAGLQHLTKGEKRSISLSAEQAYGFYDQSKVILYPLKRVPDAGNLRVGQAITIVGKSGEARTYKVLQVFGETVSLDGNHPLAGQDLVFEIETLDVRDATAEEIYDSQNMVATQLLH